MSPLPHIIRVQCKLNDISVTERGVKSNSCLLNLVIVVIGADVAVSKAMLNIIGLDMGPVRLPLQELTSEAKDRLKGDMKAMSLL